MMGQVRSGRVKPGLLPSLSKGEVLLSCNAGFCALKLMFALGALIFGRLCRRGSSLGVQYVGALCGRVAHIALAAGLQTTKCYKEQDVVFPSPTRLYR